MLAVGLAACHLLYARAVEADETTAVVSMRVLLDGEPSFSREAVLTDQGTQYDYAGR